MNAPLNIERWLRSGHGRAATLILEHGLSAESRAALEYACTHSVSFDVYENHRAPYLLRLIDLAGERAYFREFVIRTLTSSEDSEIEWQQVLMLARLMNERQRDKNLVAAIHACVERIGPEAPVSEHDGKRAESSDSHIPFHKWFPSASESEIRERFATGTDGSALRMVQRMIRHFFDWDELSFLIPIAEHDSRPKLRRAAIFALQARRHPRIRQLALRLCNSDQKAEGGRLLVSHPSARDVLLLDAHIRTLTDLDEIHNFAFAITGLLQANPKMRGGPAALRYLYEAGPCSECRVGVVRLLNLLDALPDAWRHECRYDALSHVAIWARPRYRYRRW